MFRFRSAVLALPISLLIGLCLLPLPAQAEEPTAASAPPTLDDLAWIAGHWQGEPPGGGQADEIWTPPAAGAMMGSFRWTRGDRVIVYEFLLIEETADGIVLRLRHFNPGSVGWEEKDAPLNFALIEGGQQGVTFQAQTEKGWLRLAMRPAADAGLVVVLEREGQETLTFEYSRAPARG